MDAEYKVIDHLKAATKPQSAGQIAEATGLDRKVVDKVMAKLKKSGQIESPKVCYWQWKPA
ncbi:MAG: Rrf2 family transcriptional regulator [Deltaproteobacteria bacterium]|nr:Rrf2 family transcriptional regulator [Deltaproteobacteria bacterium]